MNNNTKEEGNPQRKKELTDKVSMLVKTTREKKKPRNMQEGIAFVSHTLYMANIHALKEFLIDRDCKGEKPRLIVESPYANSAKMKRIRTPEKIKSMQSILLPQFGQITDSNLLGMFIKIGIDKDFKANSYR